MLYDRIVGRSDSGLPVTERISPEVFSSIISEFARGAMTGQQAQDALAAVGAPLNEGELIEAQALLATFTGTAQQKINRYLEVRDVLFLARLQAPGYGAPANIKARLGV